MMGEDAFYKALGYRIRSARKQAKVTQIELAQQVGLTRTSISNIEIGQQKIQIHTLYIVAESLGLSLHELLPPILEELWEESNEQLEDLSQAEREWIKKILTTEK